MNKKILTAVLAFCLVLAFGLTLISCSAGEYSLTYETNGGEGKAEALKFNAGQKIEAPVLTKRFFTFGGWFSDEALSVSFDSFNKMPAKDLTLYAKWLPSTSGRLMFESNGGSFVAPMVGSTGERVASEPASPNKTGYVFTGWYLDRELSSHYVFGTYPEGEVTLYAKWGRDIDNYLYVTFVKYGVETEVAVADGKVTKPSDDEGVKSVWYTDAEFNSEFVFESKINRNLKLFALSYTEGLVFSGSEVKGYNGKYGNVIIPEKANGTFIKSVGNEAFFKNSFIKTVMLPDTVDSIGEYAFYKCEYLTSINVGSKVESIGKFAFSDCVRLTSGVDLSSLTTVEDSIFANCELLATVSFGQSLTQIGSYAFAGCKSLEQADLPDSVEKIFDYAFSNSGLKVFKVSAALNIFADGVLKGCADLSGIEISDKGNSKFTADNESGTFFTDNGTTLVLYFMTETNKGDTEFVLPKKVTKVMPYAFWNNKNIVSLDISKSNDGNGAALSRGALEKMDALRQLKAVRLDSVNKFLAYWFGAKTALQNSTVSLYVPKTLESLTFTGTESVSAVPDYAFYGCTGLSSVSGLENVTSIGSGAYAYTAFESIKIGSNVASIGNSAFKGCGNLSALLVEEDNAVYASFDGCLYTKDLRKLLFVPPIKSDIIFSGNVETIGESAFFQSEAETLTIPSTVTKIEFGAFSSMKNLSSYTADFIGSSLAENRYMQYVFGAKITPAADNTINFSGDKSPAALKEVNINVAQTNIPTYAFAYCSRLETFNNGKNNEAQVENIGDFAFTGTSVKEAVFADTVKTIGARAYAVCDSLKTVRIGKGVTKIGFMAFAASGLESIVFEEGTADLEVGDGAFLAPTESIQGNLYSHSLLKELVLSNNITSIGSLAFAYVGVNYLSEALGTEYGRFTLEFDVANSRLKKIGNTAFAMSGVTKVVLPASIEQIGGIAFGACPLLEKVVIGSAQHEASALTLLDDGAFAENQMFTSFTLYKTIVSDSDAPVLGTGKVPNIAGLEVFAVQCPNIYVPSDSVDIYKSAWSMYEANIVAIK